MPFIVTGRLIRSHLLDFWQSIFGRLYTEQACSQARTDVPKSMVFIRGYNKGRSRPAVVPSRSTTTGASEWPMTLGPVLLRVLFPGMLRQHRLTFRKNLYRHAIRSSISNFFSAPLVDTCSLNKQTYDSPWRRKSFTRSLRRL